MWREGKELMEFGDQVDMMVVEEERGFQILLVWVLGN